MLEEVSKCTQRRKREQREKKKEKRFNSRGSESRRKTSKRCFEAIRNKRLEDSPVKTHSLPSLPQAQFAESY